MTPQSAPLDGISPQEPAGAPAAPQPAPQPLAQERAASPNDTKRKRVEILLVALFAVPYLMFLGWCLFLMSVLPDATGEYDSLIPSGSASGFVGAMGLLLIGVFAAVRIVQRGKKLAGFTVAMSAVRLLVVLIPGIAIGIMTPITISAEPKLWMAIAEPESTDELIAPISITFSVEDAQNILQRRNVRALSYKWDFDGDGQVNEETVLPMATAFYNRMGSYNIAVAIEASDGKSRTIRFRLPIQKEVFQVTPPIPIVDEPAKFSVAHLVDLPEEIQEVRWDFDSDGEADETTSNLDVVHTFVRPGIVSVSATVIMQNQNQQEHKRDIEIRNPAPLPFPVQIQSEPNILVSPPPFQTIFEVITDEPVREVKWNFGDGEERTGARVGYTFAQKGNFVVTAEVRSESGDLARLTTLVRVVEELSIPDLSFTGTPTVDMRTSSISGEVPLMVNLTPRSSLPLISYTWEAPEATSFAATEATVEAVYRRPDTYTLVLLAQDPAGHAMRKPIRVEVKPPSTLISIKMNPEGGVAPLDVTFDASETRIPNQTVAGFEWLFGEELEGATPRPGSAVMRYTYEKPGTYIVRLLARTASGEVQEATRTVVVRAPLLDACFTASRLRGTAPLGVKFTMDCTTGLASTIEWNFGDGARTDEKNPIHVFEEAGEYKVVLSVRDASGNSSTKELLITAE